MADYAAVTLACLFALPLTALLIPLGPRLGLMDHPDPRKVHTRPTPRAGGLAIYLAMLAATGVLALLPLGTPTGLTFVLLGLGLPIFLLGLQDDLRPLPWQVRLVTQAVMAVLVVGFLAPGGWLISGAAVLWIVALTNAMNMLDNMDGLSGGVALGAAVFFVGVLGLHPSEPDGFRTLLLLLIGALVGFLVFNRPPARIFLGDAGSTLLGFLLALAGLRIGIRPGSALGLQPGSPPWSGAVPLCILAVPCYDLTTVVLLRLRQGRSPFHADKQHLSHRLVALGLSKPAAVMVILLLGVASGAAGLLLYRMTDPLGAWLVGLVVVATWAAVLVIEYLPRWPTGKEASHGTSQETHPAG